MCADVADIARANIASIYVREDDRRRRCASRCAATSASRPRRSAASTCARARASPASRPSGCGPVSVAVGKRDRHFKYISGLGEEKYPALLAVPISARRHHRRRAGAAAGRRARVLRRRGGAGDGARRRHQPRHRARRGARAPAARAAPIAARCGCRGDRSSAARRWGAPSCCRRCRRWRGSESGRAAAAARPRGDGRAPADRAAQGGRRRERRPPPSELRSLSLILEDWRFRAGLAEGCAAPAPLKALSALARSYARVAFTVPPSDRDGAEMIRDRAAEIEDLCVFVYAASLRGRPLVRSGRVVVAERLRPFAAIHAIMSGAVGLRRRGRDAGRRRDRRAGPLGRAADARRRSAACSPGCSPRTCWCIEAGGLRINPPATAIAHFRNPA